MPAGGPPHDYRFTVYALQRTPEVTLQRTPEVTGDASLDAAIQAVEAAATAPRPADRHLRPLNETDPNLAVAAHGWWSV